ncbi:hypothetical protein DAPPUDRAFT_106236 [Daphnia pulex]|uniref:Uncharacterized protein n=1 Tax=Daphnia pulex TaxID=6669 RepID=E9GT05_DAPPU|nr:hypothetical protein DAPPUDRAFT_106236 [Daphnia pulex]|eukprot:EFX77356.1 hypothetical protein DAPPUDRAFT_106236 [Daphnia pulex]
MGPEDEANRRPHRKKPCGSETQIPPVIIKLTDGKFTFMTMHIAERMRIQNEFIGAIGEPRESTVLMGGDLAVVAHNKNQQADLMALKNIIGRPVLCSLPNSASAYRTGHEQGDKDPNGRHGGCEREAQPHRRKIRRRLKATIGKRQIPDQQEEPRYRLLGADEKLCQPNGCLATSVYATTPHQVVECYFNTLSHSKQTTNTNTD